jgi:hypothetical protein
MVAAGFGLSFVAACLGVCFAGAPASDHGCCPRAEESVAAAARDCCSVVPGESHAAAKVVSASGVTNHTPPAAADSAPSASLPVRSVTLAASPPLVLRI